MTPIETIFNKAPNTILQLPDQTHTAILLAETGFLTIEMIVNKKKIMHANRVLAKEEPGLIEQITQAYGEKELENYKKNTVKQMKS